ncbi:TetR/AcrR family transcriptional regulator [Aeromicrobium sp.]|uniref:TetR/AcrR family transcriptional regulator n=1 Tax=Aeromicrobium sp. TaxID=1871063 RepID=UPI0019A77DDD|nr:TetR/AcrR family transcriptional regulator [Aeromicrobium sp.]MBC7631487.1 TetR/AcrR family transcriptional regulator [Aeromicrobium sp.]
MATRTRLSREARQDQLLDLGAGLFADRSYEDVHIEELAEVAGVSRGLLYHYFPNKRAFFAAMVRRESGRMSELTLTDPTVPILEQLNGGIESYLDYCDTHRMGVRAVFRGAASADPEVQAIVDADIAVQQMRIIAAVQPHGAATELLQIAVRSWLNFLRSASHEWLDSSDISREEIRDLCANALVATLLALPESSRPTALAEITDQLG